MSREEYKRFLEDRRHRNSEEGRFEHWAATHQCQECGMDKHLMCICEDSDE